MKMGSIIKRYRVSKSISQGVFAGRLDISQNYLSMIELGKRVPSSDIIERFSRCSGVSANALLVLSSDVPCELQGKDRSAFAQLQQTLEELLLS